MNCNSCDRVSIYIFGCFVLETQLTLCGKDFLKKIAEIRGSATYNGFADFVLESRFFFVSFGSKLAKIHQWSVLALFIFNLRFDASHKILQ